MIPRMAIAMGLGLQGLWAVDIGAVPPDLVTPPATLGEPAPGKRVIRVGEGYEGGKVHHLLYLPTDWVKGRKYPVIVEFPGNRWKNGSGEVDTCDLGYGISGGEGVIWISLPFVDSENAENATMWWGDVGATVEYCKVNVRRICTEYGGDPANVFIAGFSRGAIACNHIGLHDDEIASLWRGFICHSHYDGVMKWGYAGSDRGSAAVRLKRLGDRPQFISHEASVDPVKEYLRDACPSGDFTFQAMPFDEHTDDWVLRDVPERKVLREWFRRSMVHGGE